MCLQGVMLLCPRASLDAFKRHRKRCLLNYVKMIDYLYIITQRVNVYLKKNLNLGLQKTFDTLMYKHFIFLTFHIENRNKTIRIETTFRKNKLLKSINAQVAII